MKRLLSCLAFATLTACGGSGGSDDSGTVLSGTLTQGSAVAHALIVAKHSAGAKIENVQICALGECSTTDGEGQWGFLIEENFAGGAIAFSIVGHGIDTTTTINIPAAAEDVVLDLVHANGVVNADHITIDGETSHHESEHHE